MQVSPVATSCPSPRTAAPPCLPLGIKDSVKEDMRLFFCFGSFCFEAFAFCFWLLGFWLFGVGALWKGKEFLKGKGLLKGKSWRKIAEGEKELKGGLLKGKELLKENY
jgi:hypothetical protein